MDAFLRTLEGSSADLRKMSVNFDCNGATLSPPSPSAKITPIISTSSTPIPLHTTLTPSLPISQLPTTPTVELAILPFPSALPLDKKEAINHSLANMRSNMLHMGPTATADGNRQ
ncbi:hypothetical protein PAAG_11206 [Paracoccidioides lutzii Pb01]|uniref:Uncharacterized protein n=1 Tax=Paracoccidioides lutzii (strain ATCC MYA-826 / Pb01) TaxID=502779 RepID=A0A0A2V7F2_PARBA|nr:hypothetical protein PAAG_11206 [Paracoccidioides lutzii Pb01]KGQ02030.1 hypothetical protein PAAG_11206 [Paracoccidioides lutzii Pb01]